MGVKRERRIGRPYVWNAWALETHPSYFEPEPHYSCNPFREAIERPERIARWEDDGGLAHQPELGWSDVLAGCA